MNIWDLLQERFEQNKSSMSICNSEGDFISYGELLKKTLALSNLILSNTHQGSRVVVLNSDSYFDALGVLGVLAAGCTVVPISLKYGEVNCCHILNKIEPDLMITNDQTLPEIVEKTIREINIKKLPFALIEDYENQENQEKHEKPKNDIAMIMSTSGTTGIPRGIMLSHENIVSNVRDIAAYFRLNEEDHILIARPLYHAAVMTGEFLHGLLSGSRITFYSEDFSPRRLLRFMEKIKCTTMCGTPTLFYHLGLHKKNLSLPDLNKIVVSGEGLLPQVAEKLLSSFPNTDFFNVYGLTEASPRVSYLEPKYFSSKVGSVGLPLRSVNIKIVDEDGKQLQAQEKGEIIVKGPNIMQGYWGDIEQTENVIKKSWLHTKDIGYFDEDGFLYVVGRKDHMIIRAGMNIYPQEIENTLLQDEAIKEIMAWGEPDPK